MKAVLSWYVQHRAADHARNMFKLAKHFFAEMLARTERSIDSITNLHLMCNCSPWVTEPHGRIGANHAVGQLQG
jgi:hypothetical protein